MHFRAGHNLVNYIIFSLDFSYPERLKTCFVQLIDCFWFWNVQVELNRTIVTSLLKLNCIPLTSKFQMWIISSHLMKKGKFLYFQKKLIWLRISDSAVLVLVLKFDTLLPVLSLSDNLIAKRVHWMYESVICRFSILFK